MRRFLAAFAFVLAPLVASAQQNVTVRDIVELSRAGLGEEALLALIEVNRPIFPVDVDTLKTLKAAGVPPNVITAMIRSGRMPLPEALQPAAEPVAVEAVPETAGATVPSPAPQVIVVDHHDEPVVREVSVAYPVYVPVTVRPIRRGVDNPVRPVTPRVVEPVYWGWGGKLRPDAWKVTIDPQQPDARMPLPQRR